jgi:biotin carboxyl carrier protein
MKVDIQNSKIELVKVDNQWVAQANQNVSFIPQSENTLLIQTQNQTIQVRCIGIDKANKTVTLLYNNQKYSAKITEPMDELLKSMGLENALVQKISEVKAPMPGLVLDVLVSPGDSVEIGQKILVLEAMKMESMLRAERDAIIKSIHVRPGEIVAAKDLLLELG